MIELFICILLFLGIGMVDRHFKSLKKQNELIIELLREKTKIE